MTVKIFVLGRPGSGKSHGLRFIFGHMQQKNSSLPIELFKDYDILRAMFEADIEQHRFRPTEYEGFEVIDPSVLDEALREIERIVKIAVSTDVDKAIFIELARDSYQAALKQFSKEFLQDAYFLLVEADIETCIRRIHERVAYHVADEDWDGSNDDHFVSDKVMRNYYFLDNRNYMLTNFKQDYDIKKDIEIIENIGSLEELKRNVLRFINFILEKEI